MATLPYDVLDQIFTIAFARVRKERQEPTLREWTCVGQNWTALAQRALFHTVTLAAPKHERALVGVLQRAPHLRAHVRELAVGTDIVLRPHVRAALLPLLPELRRVAFVGVYPDWVLLSSVPGLTSVRVDLRAYGYRTSDPLAGAALPSAGQIELQEFEIANAQATLRETPVLPQAAFLRWLGTTATRAQQSLRSATYTAAQPRDLGKVAKFLRVQGALRHLTLELASESLTGSLGASDIASLKIVAALGCVSIAPVLGLLRESSLPGLRTLHLVLRPCHERSDFIPFGPAHEGDDEGDAAARSTRALPHSMLTQLAKIVVKLEGFARIMDYDVLLRVFGDAKERGVLRIHTGTAQLYDSEGQQIPGREAASHS